MLDVNVDLKLSQVQLENLSLDEMLAIVQHNAKDLLTFMRKYDLTLTGVVEHCEHSNVSELHYVFDNGLGGYTMDAITESL